MSKWIITVLSFTVILTSYFAYNCWRDEKTAKKETKLVIEKFDSYKNSNNAIKLIEKNIINEIQNANNKTNNFRNDVDNGLVELRVKVETIERDSSTASNTANTALQLARTARQDYFNLTNGISYNKAIIEGWQEYYCTEIAPKNNTLFMCEQISKQ